MIKSEILVPGQVLFQQLHQSVVEVVLIPRFFGIAGGGEVDGLFDLFGEVEVFTGQ